MPITNAEKEGGKKAKPEHCTLPLPSSTILKFSRDPGRHGQRSEILGGWDGPYSKSPEEKTVGNQPMVPKKNKRRLIPGW